jgi:hypothetical protein
MLPSFVWSLSSREVHGFREFENRVLKTACGLKTNEVTGGWRNLHTEKPRNLFPSTNIIRTTKLERCDG